MGYEQRRKQWGSGEKAMAHTHTHTHTHTHSVPRETQNGWSLGQGSDVILTNVSVAPPLIKLVGYEHREYAVVGGGAGYGIHTHTHTVSR